MSKNKKNILINIIQGIIITIVMNRVVFLLEHYMFSNISGDTSLYISVLVGCFLVSLLNEIINSFRYKNNTISVDKRLNDIYIEIAVALFAARFYLYYLEFPILPVFVISIIRILPLEFKNGRLNMIKTFIVSSLSFCGVLVVIKALIPILEFFPFYLWFCIVLGLLLGTIYTFLIKNICFGIQIIEITFVMLYKGFVIGSRHASVIAQFEMTSYYAGLLCYSYIIAIIFSNNIKSK